MTHYWYLNVGILELTPFFSLWIINNSDPWPRSVIASMHNMQRLAGYYYSWKSCHDSTIQGIS